MEPFWANTPLHDLTRAQWESLCDGCARCCLQKLEDEDTREVHYTRLACYLLDLDTCRCRDYPNRSRRVPNCVTLTLADLQDPYWLPTTCAYRLLAEGQPLPDWHPLVSGDPWRVVEAGISIMGRVIHETDDEDPEHHLIDWIR